jgi:hypothetical protein
MTTRSSRRCSTRMPSASSNSKNVSWHRRTRNLAVRGDPRGGVIGFEPTASSLRSGWSAQPPGKVDPPRYAPAAPRTADPGRFRAEVHLERSQAAGGIERQVEAVSCVLLRTSCVGIDPPLDGRQNFVHSRCVDPRSPLDLHSSGSSTRCCTSTGYPSRGRCLRER